MVVYIMRIWSLSQLPARGVRWMPVIGFVSCVTKHNNQSCVEQESRRSVQKARSRAVSSMPGGYVDRREKIKSSLYH